MAGKMNGFRMDVESVTCDEIVPNNRFFRVAEVLNTASEKPSDAIDGYILAFRWEALSYCTQIFVDPNKNDIWIRSDKGTGFGEWEKMAKV